MILYIRIVIVNFALVGRPVAWRWNLISSYKQSVAHCIYNNICNNIKRVYARGAMYNIIHKCARVDMYYITWNTFEGEYNVVQMKSVWDYCHYFTTSIWLGNRKMFNNILSGGVQSIRSRQTNIIFVCGGLIVKQTMFMRRRCDEPISIFLFGRNWRRH